jgi:hypothetical protein
MFARDDHRGLLSSRSRIPAWCAGGPSVDIAGSSFPILKGALVAMPVTNDEIA